MFNNLLLNNNNNKNRNRNRNRNKDENGNIFSLLEFNNLFQITVFTLKHRSGGGVSLLFFMH